MRRRQPFTRTAFAAFLFALALRGTLAMAGIVVQPWVPLAGADVSVSVRGMASGTPVSVVDAVVTVVGTTIDIVVSVDHGSVNATTVEYGAIKQLPNLPAADYTVRHFRRDRYPTLAWSDPTLVESMPFSIVAPSNVVQAIEYYSPARDHYFMTIDAAEIRALDLGSVGDWQRTGHKLEVFAQSPSYPGTLKPVCRFYGLPSADLDTHFFSANPDECAFVQATWPDKWVLESQAAFYAFLPADWYCGTEWVFRFYNGRADANHRYTTSREVVQEMLARGWIREGTDGTRPDPIAMCAAR